MAAKPTEGAGCLRLAVIENPRPLRPCGAPPRNGEDLGRTHLYPSETVLTKQPPNRPFQHHELPQQPPIVADPRLMIGDHFGECVHPEPATIGEA